MALPLSLQILNSPQLSPLSPKFSAYQSPSLRCGVLLSPLSTHLSALNPSHSDIARPGSNPNPSPTSSSTSASFASRSTSLSSTDMPSPTPPTTSRSQERASSRSPPPPLAGPRLHHDLAQAPLHQPHQARSVAPLPPPLEEELGDGHSIGIEEPRATMSHHRSSLVESVAYQLMKAL